MRDPPAHIEAAFEHDSDSGIGISIRISAELTNIGRRFHR